MPIIPFADWNPDAADLGNPGFNVGINVRPGLNSSLPMPMHTPLTNALDDYARGAIDIRDKDLNVLQYVGDEAKLYVLATATWTDKSIGGGYSTAAEEIWEFVKFKNVVIATNWDDNIQSMTIGGSIFANLTTDFKCRHLAVIRDHVVAANTFDATDDNVPDRVRWSAIDDETDWTVSPVTGSDVRDLKSGDIRRIFGGSYGTIFTSNSVYRMDWEGAPTWFRIDETLPGYGIFAPGCAAQRGNIVYGIGDAGVFATINGTTTEDIGSKKVNDFVLNDIDDNYLYRISSVADTDGYVYWSYPGPGNTGGQPNRVLIYDRATNKWGLLHQEMGMLWRAGGVGFTMDGLDSVSASLDDLMVTLDSSQWKGGGASILAGFDENNIHGFFDGPPLTATLETKEVEIFAGHRTHLNSFTPLVDGGTVTARIGSRRRQVGNVSYTTSLSQSASGRFTKRVNANFHRIELTVSGTWKNAIGVSINEDDARQGEGRG